MKTHKKAGQNIYVEFKFYSFNLVPVFPYTHEHPSNSSFGLLYAAVLGTGKFCIVYVRSLYVVK